jgi:hypothetical protein
MEKICKKCQQPKEISQYYKHPTYKDGLRPECITCSKAYDLILKHKVRIIPESKVCCKCKQLKHRTRFHIRTRNADGLRSECIQCTRQEEKKYRTRTPDKSYYRKIKQKYGISKEEHTNLMIKFNGCCAICKSENKLVIDHCHATNQIRGLLCANCNAGIGMLGDNVEILEAAIKYLKDNNNATVCPSTCA